MATVRVDQILIRDLMQHLEQKGANWKKHQNTYSYLKTFDHQSYYRLIQKHESSLKIKMKKKSFGNKKNTQRWHKVIYNYIMQSHYQWGHYQ